MVMQRLNTVTRGDADPAMDEQCCDLLILTNIGQLMAPERVAPCSIVAGGTKIVGLVSDTAALQALPGVCVLDVEGGVVCPGLIDNHVHVTGGGGEAGPESKCPEAHLSQLVDAGITTVVGLLGTDSVTRTQEALVSKTAALAADGLTAYHWVGGYRVPVQTITGDIQKDLMAVSSCIGVGEVAVGDHRSSAPTPQELARIAMDARVGGMLSGKAGLLCCHMGTAANRMQLLHATVALGVPITQLLPTHMERAALPISGKEAAKDGSKEGEKAGRKEEHSEKLDRLASKKEDSARKMENVSSKKRNSEGEEYADVEAWLSAGGFCDFTAGKAAADALAALQKRGNTLSRCTMSSDAFGSYPDFDAHGRLIKYRMSLPSTLLHTVRTLHHKLGWPLDQALRLVTRNPARVLNMAHKGRIKVGCDADLLVLDKKTLELKFVIAQGRIVRTPIWTQGNMMERGDRIRHFRASVTNKDRLAAPATVQNGDSPPR